MATGVPDIPLNNVDGIGPVMFVAHLNVSWNAGCEVCPDGGVPDIVPNIAPNDPEILVIFIAFVSGVDAQSLTDEFPR